MYSLNSSASSKANQSTRTNHNQRDQGYGQAQRLGRSASAGPAAPGDQAKARHQEKNRKGQSPPCGNTGDKLEGAGKAVQDQRPTLSVDWWSSTHPMSHLGSIVSILDHLLGEHSESSVGKNWFPDGSMRWPSGAVLARNIDKGRFWLSINGDSLSMIGAANWLDLIQTLMDEGQGTCTRVDLAADFSRDVLSLDDVADAARVGNLLGFRRFEVRKPMVMSGGAMVPEGYSATFGRRGKDGKGVYLRFYDKGLESRGEVDVIRFEAEFNGDLAGGSEDNDGKHREGVGEILASCQSQAEFQRTIARLVAGSIDFVERGNYTHKRDMKRLPWWEKVVQLLEMPMVLVAGRVKSSISRTAAWIKRSVAASFSYLAMVSESCGVEFEQICQAIRAYGDPKIDWKRPHKIEEGWHPSEVFEMIPRARG